MVYTFAYAVAAVRMFSSVVNANEMLLLCILHRNSEANRWWINTVEKRQSGSATAREWETVIAAQQPINILYICRRQHQFIIIEWYASRLFVFFLFGSILQKSMHSHLFYSESLNNINWFDLWTILVCIAQHSHRFKVEWNNRKGRKMQSETKRYDQLAITKTVCLFRWIRCHFVITTMSETIWFSLCILLS